MNQRTGFVTIATGLLLSLTGTETTWARNFRVNQLPNGAVSSCANCHVNPTGGGTRTPFGNRVFQIIGGSSGSVPFWSASLAREDADGDGYCNGQELRDPDGDGVPINAVGVTNPGVASSRPANAQPAFSSTPTAQAFLGLPYLYQASATDTDACQAWTFSKAAGPAWLSVSADGLVSGTPPEGAGGDVAVQVQVQDNGTPAPLSNTQIFTLSVVASYAGWQALNFSLPAEADLAGQTKDPDGDGLINALEYAYRTNPRSANGVAPPVLTFTPAGQLSASLVLRDDDPKLTARMEVADTVLFSPATSLAGTVSDPVVGDGLKTWTFVDTVSSSGTVSRFARILVEIRP